MCLGSNVLKTISFSKSLPGAAFKILFFTRMKISTRVRSCGVLLLLLFGLGCAQVRKWDSSTPAFRQIEPSQIHLDSAKLNRALENKIRDCQLNKKDLGVEALQFCEQLASRRSLSIKRALQPFGRAEWGEMLVTGYYQPEITCDRVPSQERDAPMLRAPEDLVRVDFASFGISKTTPQTQRGYLVKHGEVKWIKPVPDRSRIEELANSQNVIGYCNDVDLFFLQIQGSGRVRWKHNSVIQQVTYADQNGYSYQAIGKFLKDRIEKPITAEKIKVYLRSLGKLERTQLLNQNPSYVFFKEHPRALTASGFTPMPLLTVAIDRKVFRANSLLYIEFKDEELQKYNTLAWGDDAGGAIKGVDRVDLYMGEGESVAEQAGALNHLARVTVIELSE